MQQKNVIIMIKNLTIKIDKEIILENINWEIRKGELWALMGENGAGKTTLAKIISGLLDNYHITGKISIHGKIVYLPQTINREYVPLLVKEAINLYHIKKRYVELFKLSEVENKRIDELSGGMAQALFLSLALSQDADLYILDEPNTALDYEKEETLYRIFEEKVQKEKKSIIVITHEIGWVKKAVKHIACIHKKEKQLMFHCPVLHHDGVEVDHGTNNHIASIQY
ncbi:MAG: ATP-binding cassette domain-containing protein [Candidatus Nanohaloarchaeota archaeon]|nr:ATP-binding cassette domain-containing protein [Candidatus Nanohaloarchaeota archaeon]